MPRRKKEVPREQITAEVLADLGVPEDEFHIQGLEDKLVVTTQTAVAKGPPESQ